MRHNTLYFPALPSPRFLSLSIFPLFHPPSLSLWHLTSSFAYHRLRSSSSLLPPDFDFIFQVLQPQQQQQQQQNLPSPSSSTTLSAGLHSCHVPTKGYMAHFLISCIVGYLGSQACLLESYLYPHPHSPTLLTAGRTTFVDLVFFLAFNRIKMKERTNAMQRSKRKGGEGKKKRQVP